MKYKFQHESNLSVLPYLPQSFPNAFSSPEIGNVWYVPNFIFPSCQLQTSITDHSTPCCAQAWPQNLPPAKANQSEIWTPDEPYLAIPPPVILSEKKNQNLNYSIAVVGCLKKKKRHVDEPVFKCKKSLSHKKVTFQTLRKIIILLEKF